MANKHKHKKLDYGVGPVGLNIILAPAMKTSCPAHPQAQALSNGIADASGHPGATNSPGGSASASGGPAAGGAPAGGPAGGSN